MITVVKTIVTNVTYKNSRYYKITHRSLAVTKYNKGYNGEYQVYKILSSYEKKGARFLFNCYLPKKYGETTEIDVLMIYKSGIYVFESKNYGGWIFGNASNKMWTQTLPNGRRRARKEHFYNPIWQNEQHIKCLKNVIARQVPVHSIIVFSDRCTFKSIDLNTAEANIVRRRNLYTAVSDIDNAAQNTITTQQINEIYDELYSGTQVDHDVKSKHVLSAQSYGKDRNSMPYIVEDNVLKCPRCHGNMVIREAKKGSYAGSKFYGCSNYPKCRYTRKLEQVER